MEVTSKDASGDYSQMRMQKGSYFAYTSYSFTIYLASINELSIILM